MFPDFIHWTGRLLRKMGTRMMERASIRGIWIDIGAYRGEVTIGYAKHNPGLRIYAVEPNLSVAIRMMGHAPNFVVIPMAIAEVDGCADFNLNEFEMASSLLPLSEEGIRSWVGLDSLGLKSVIKVPTIRLDTLMNQLGVEKVDFLKIDTQGMDLAILKSAGNRLRDVSKITLEVAVAPVPIYLGASLKEEVLRFLDASGFTLVGVESQTSGQEENLTFIRTQDA